jgi:Tfp pilus assembly protein PilO
VGGKRAPLLAGIGVAVLALLLVVLFVLPKMGEVTEAQDQLSLVEDEEQNLLARKQALEAAEAEAPENEATIAAVDAQIPEVADEAGLMILLQNAADSAGLEVSQFAISEPAFDADTGLSLMAIQVSAEGTYFQIADFLYNIETLPRAAKVLTSGLSTTGDATSSTPTLSLSASLEAYTTDADPGLPGHQDEVGTTATGQDEEA